MEHFITHLSVLLYHADLVRARALHNNEAIVEDLIEIGQRVGEEGAHDEAKRYFIDANRRAMALRNPFLVARSALQLGCSAAVRQDWVNARTLMEQAIPAFREHGDHTFLIDAQLRLAVVYAELNQLDEAVSLLEEAIASAKALGDTLRAIYGLDDIGGIAYRDQRFRDAAQYWEEGLELSRRKRNRSYRAKLSFFLSIALVNLGELDRARQLLRDSSSLYRALGEHDRAARSEKYLSEIA